MASPEVPTSAAPEYVSGAAELPKTLTLRDNPGRKRKQRKYDPRETRAALGFLSPWILGFLVFTLGPMIWSLVLTFTNYGGRRWKFTGVKNYQELFTDPRVGTALYNTFIYAVLYVPLAIIFSLGLAMLLNRVKRGSGFFRTVYYLPVMTPGVAVAVMFSLMLNGNFGLINKALALVGIQGPQWLTDPAWIKPAIVLMSLWGLGGAIVIFLAALKNVPAVLYEAAELDGAGPVKRFLRVTVPMISSTLFFQVIVLTINAIQMFDKVFVLFGNPGQSTYASDASLFYTLYLFKQAFQNLRFGYASALAWLLFVIIMVITLIQVKVGNRFVYYENDQR